MDIDETADHSTDLPHMLPSPPDFAVAVGKLGISDRDTIVVYDGHGMFSSPRVWFTFRLFGADDVFTLEGGLPRWKAQGRPLESGRSRIRPRPSRPAGAAISQSNPRPCGAASPG